MSVSENTVNTLIGCSPNPNTITVVRVLPLDVWTENFPLYVVLERAERSFKKFFSFIQDFSQVWFLLISLLCVFLSSKTKDKGHKSSDIYRSGNYLSYLFSNRNS